MSISARVGFNEEDLRDEVAVSIENYINSRLIGDNVFKSKIIERAMRIQGVENAILSNPTSDIIVLENERVSSSDANGNTLVTVG